MHPGTAACAHVANFLTFWSSRIECSLLRMHRPLRPAPLPHVRHPAAVGALGQTGDRGAPGSWEPGLDIEHGRASRTRRKEARTDDGRLGARSRFGRGGLATARDGTPTVGFCPRRLPGTRPPISCWVHSWSAPTRAICSERATTGATAVFRALFEHGEQGGRV